VGVRAGGLHGGKTQRMRTRTLAEFREGRTNVLVATDVAARGIDVENVTHVINFQCPEDEKTYVHRIGRTGRAGKAGVAITLVDWDEEHRWKLINDALSLDLPTPAETYSTSDHLFTDLGIPEGSTGRLPLAKRTRVGLSAEPQEDLGGGRRRARGARGRRAGGAGGSAGTGGEARGRRRTRRRAGKDVSDAENTPTGQDHVAPTDQGGAGGDSGRPARRRRRRRAGVDITGPGSSSTGETAAPAD